MCHSNALTNDVSWTHVSFYLAKVEDLTTPTPTLMTAATSPAHISTFSPVNASGMASSPSSMIPRERETPAGGGGERGLEGRERRRDPNIALPQRRVHNVASEVTTTSPNSEVSFAIARATELFLEALVCALSSKYKTTNNNSFITHNNDATTTAAPTPTPTTMTTTSGGKEEITIEYEEIAETVRENERFSFLCDVIPCKCSIDTAFPTLATTAAVVVGDNDDNDDDDADGVRMNGSTKEDEQEEVHHHLATTPSSAVIEVKSIELNEESN